MAQAEGPAGAIAGTVQDAETNAPLAAVTVSVPAQRRVTATDAAGRYRIGDVPPGPVVLLLRRIGYRPQTLTALVAAGDTLEISIALSPSPVTLDPIETHADLPGLVAVGGSDESSPRALTAADIREHPLLAEPDALAALGGGEVGVRAESPIGITVRGGGPDQVAHSLDGLPLLSPFHAGGVISAISPDVLSHLELRGSALPTEAAEALSGAILATTRAPGERQTVAGGLSSTQGRVAADGPLRGNLRYLVGARLAFPGLLAHPGDPTYLRGASHDWLAKLETTAWGGRLEVLGFGAGTDVSASALASPQLVPGRPPPRNEFAWSGTSVGARFHREVAGVSLAVQAWRARGAAEADWRALDSLPEALTSRERRDGVSVQVDRPDARWQLSAGLRIERVATDYRLRASPTGARSLEWHARSALWQPFGRVSTRLGPSTQAEFTVAATLARGAARVSPAFALRQRLGTRVAMTLSASRRHQFAQSLRNPESVVGHIFPAELPMLAGTAGVGIARGEEAGLELDFRPASGLQLEVKGYARRGDRLTLVAPRQADPFTTVATRTGRGRSAGGSVALRWSGRWFDLVGRLGLQRVRLAYDDSTYTPAWGGRELLDLGLVLRPAARTAVRLSLHREGGARTTTIEDPFEWEACNLQDRGCEFAGSPHRRAEPLGAAPLPTYLRVDAGVRQELLGERAPGRQVITLYGTVTNLFARRNLAAYTRGTSGARVPVTSRPRSPLVVGLEWVF